MALLEDGSVVELADVGLLGAGALDDWLDCEILEVIVLGSAEEGVGVADEELRLVELGESLETLLRETLEEALVELLGDGFGWADGDSTADDDARDELTDEADDDAISELDEDVAVLLI